LGILIIYKGGNLCFYFAQDYKKTPHQSDHMNVVMPMAVIGGLGIGSMSGLITSELVPRNITQKQLDDANKAMYRAIRLKK
jgi:hypothetical protein